MLNPAMFAAALGSWNQMMGMMNNGGTPSKSDPQSSSRYSPSGYGRDQAYVPKSYPKDDSSY